MQPVSNCLQLQSVHTLDTEALPSPPLSFLPMQNPDHVSSTNCLE